MDSRDLTGSRWAVGSALILLVAVAWWFLVHQPRRDALRRLQLRETALVEEEKRLTRAIAEAREAAAARPAGALPTRFASPATSALAPVDRLNYLLESLSAPANDLDLSYFSVTPLEPIRRPRYVEIPFQLSVTGDYAPLADYLYLLEHERDFIVRELSITAKGEDAIQADFQLAAILLTDESLRPAQPEEARPPGRPTSLELARDPFSRPPAKLAVGPDGKPYFLNVPPGLRLQGVMETGRGQLSAIINKEPYKVGQTIQNMKITKITREGVTLEDAQRTYFLEMARPEIRTR